MHQPYKDGSALGGENRLWHGEHAVYETLRNYALRCWARVRQVGVMLGTSQSSSSGDWLALKISCSLQYRTSNILPGPVGVPSYTLNVRF